MERFWKMMNEIEIHALQMDLMQEVYDVLQSQDKLLSSTEKKILAYSLVLLERKEPVGEILGQLAMRLDFFENHDNEGFIRGGMNREVLKLSQKLRENKFVMSSSVVPGVREINAVTWDDAIKGHKFTEDEGFVGLGYAQFDPSEKYKSTEERVAVPDNELIRKARAGGFLGSVGRGGAFIGIILIVILALVVVLGLLLK